MSVLLAVVALAVAPLAAAPQVASDGGPTEAELVGELEAVERLMQRRRWQDAYERYQGLFEQHAGAEYVLARRTSIEADLQRCAFWTAHAEPELRDVLDARLEQWDPYRGRVRMAFDREHLGDLTAHRSASGVVYELPAEWSRPWTATFAGPARTLAGNQVYVLVDDARTYAVTVGHRSEGASEHVQHAVVEQLGSEVRVLASAVPDARPDGERITARVSVDEQRLKLEIGRTTVLDVRRPDPGGLGRMGLAFDGDLGELTVAGQAETGWFLGRIDAAVQAARELFLAAWDPAEHLPDWLAAAAPAAGADVVALGPFPVPETFDLVAADHPRTLEHVQRVEALLQAGRNADALRYLGDLAPRDAEPTVRAFLATIVLMVSDRPREAFEAGRGLWTAQPDSLTAGYLEAVLHAQLRRPELALERFGRLTEEHGDAWEPWYGLTSLLLLQRRVPDAVDALERGQRRAAAPGPLHRLEDRLALLLKGPPWERTFEEDARHFRVRSDTDAPTTRAVAAGVREAWWTLERVYGKVPLPEGEPVPLFLFSGEASYRAYVQDALAADMQHTAGMFSRDMQAVLVWNTPSAQSLHATIRHEVAHQYLDARFGALPPWFHEGLAESFEIVELARGQPVLGEPHPAHVAQLRTMSAVPDLRALVRMPAREFYPDAENAYPVAWAFVHFLRHTTLERRERFDALWDALDAGADATSAMDHAFDEVDWDAWNQGFRDHLTTLTEAAGKR